MRPRISAGQLPPDRVMAGQIPRNSPELARRKAEGRTSVAAGDEWKKGGTRST
jgi:hypothetical protein